ncbi:unnamed protein product [Tilletia controversa]|uniref:Telomere length regulation protein conserved domain-containing protein n=1 Tax=Tilletia controversa TaxID=13291 RepID=A0A8X7N0Z8_9BASI|nr:hypothetical protein CF328_g575 [Tilletia controversa]KAE8255014.1 hypothetical protein A4X06_0g632 [Tilletia controversa]CAD6972226.1 unnamed protein product [Tilletia controversa]
MTSRAGEDDGLAWLRAERSRMLSGERFSSLEAALGALLAVLDLLDVLPSDLQDRFPNSKWTRLTGLEATDAAKAYVLSSGWLVDAQRFFLECIVVDWVDDLAEPLSTSDDGTKSTLRDKAIQAAFAPHAVVGVKNTQQAGKKSLIAVIEDVEDIGAKYEAKLAAVGQIIASGLSATSQVLTRMSKARSQSSSSSSPHHQLTQEAAFSALLLLAVQDDGADRERHSPLSYLLCAAARMRNLAQRDKFWQDVVRELCAVPVRVSNVLGAAAGPEDLEEGPFFAAFATQLEGIVYHSTTASDSARNQVRSEHLKILLQKLVRSGVTGRAVEVAGATDGSKADFFQALLGSALRRVQDSVGSDSQGWSPSYLTSWHRLIRSLEPTELSAQFLQHLVAYLDFVCFVSQKRGDLVIDAEKGRIGAEGRSFLSTETTRSSLLVARLLKVFMPAPQGRQVQDKDTTNARFVELAADADDAEEMGEEDMRRWLRIVFGDSQIAAGGSTCFSAAMARCLAIHVAPTSGKGDGSDEALAAVIAQTVSRWASDERVRRASVAEQQYLTTLLLSLLAQCPTRSSIPAQTLQGPTFIHGVSAHLSHQDPAFRRLGMVVAEILDAAVKQGDPAAAGTTKRLDFGQSMWSGRGDGKEASRVLRTMVVGWDVSSPLRQQLPLDGPKLLEMVGLAQPAPIAETPSEEQDDLSLPVIGSMFATERQPPSTRALPERRPAAKTTQGQGPIESLIEETSTLSFLGGGKARRSRPLIADITDSGASANDATVSRPLRAYDLPNESDLEESSSSEDDSDDEPGEEALPKSSLANEDDGPELVDVTVPKKRQRRRPVYVGELFPLLRSSERSESRKGLKNSEELIRRKTGWGMEIEETAVDLALALAALQNNWSTKHFEERRTGALSALIVAAPQAAGGCIIEQYFSGHYSIAQRMAMLNSLVEAARDLAERAGQQTSLTAKQTAGKNADVLIRHAAGEARQYGEQKYPAVRQANNLNILRAPRGGTLITETSSSSSVAARRDGRPINVASLPGASISRLPRYLDIASSVFIFPLMNRFWAVINDAGVRQSRSLQGARGSRRAQSVWQGAGTGSVLSAPAIGCLLDALAVMASLARNALDFQRVIVPELLELSLATPRAMLPLIGRDVDSDDMGRIHEGATTLAVVLVDTAREADSGRFLRREKGMLLRELDMYAAEVFKVENEKERGTSSAMSRAGRASATLLLRLQEIQSQ